jgi:hypothetical protein
MGLLCQCPPSELGSHIGWENVCTVDAVARWEPSVGIYGELWECSWAC